MTIQKIISRDVWNDFVLRLPSATFLHCWEWGEFQQNLGEKVQYLGFFNGPSLKGVALVIFVSARRGSHYLCPHGPLFATQEAMLEGIADLTDYLRQDALTTKAVAFRVAPLLLSTDQNKAALQRLGFKPAPLHVHAELTWVLDIAAPEEKILQSMRKTTRHAIKKAQQRGVTTSVLDNEGALDRFWPLYQQTQQRHGFVPFSRIFLEKQLKAFQKNNMVFVVMAEYEGKDMASAILIQFGKTVYYYHGASLSNSTVPAAHLVQWQAILEAKRRGALLYNFWGIAPADNPRHPFSGITVFKKGFGGYAVDFLHAHDRPFRLSYKLLWFIDVWRRWRRGF